MCEEIKVFKVPLNKLEKEFGPSLVLYMDHSGLPLYLILHPEEIEDLKDAKPVGLEVNLPTGMDVYSGKDKHDRGRNKERLDLIFKKENKYYIVEVIDREKITPYYKKKVMRKMRLFKKILTEMPEKLENFEIEVVPIIVQPEGPLPPLTSA